MKSLSLITLTFLLSLGGFAQNFVASSFDQEGNPMVEITNEKATITTLQYCDDALSMTM